jgi:hypothetical protein
VDDHAAGLRAWWVQRGGTVTLPIPDTEEARHEVARAVHDLVLLICQGVPGCDGASVSLLRDGDGSTLAASQASCAPWTRPSTDGGAGRA